MYRLGLRVREGDGIDADTLKLVTKSCAFANIESHLNGGPLEESESEHLERINNTFVKGEDGE